MYLPSHFARQERGDLLELMRSHGFALLVGQPDGAAPLATHLPVIVRDEGEHGVIEGHLAGANPHAAALRDCREAMIVFTGPHAFVSPSWYGTELAVPTWNYIAVHAYGQPEWIAGEEEKDALLKRLIAIHDPDYAARWRALPGDYRQRMLGAIHAFRMPIARIEGKFKLSQNRPAEDRGRVRAAHAEGDASARELAAWMHRLGLA